MKGFNRVLVLLVSLTAAHTSARLLMQCSPRLMELRVSQGHAQSFQLDKWSAMPGCQAVTENGDFVIRLPLDDSLPCGVTQVRNKVTGDALYYHKVAFVQNDGTRREALVKCFVQTGLEDSANNIVKRNVLPPEFVEPDYIEITSEVSGTAPVPMVQVGVRQSGSLVGDTVNIVPGTPLTMEVYLDSESSLTYGILVSYMMVTDNTDKNETIIYNGCSQDTYIFENFNTVDGDFLAAKFRAFKFPESNYLLFKGTVDVCLDRCTGIACSNGDIGYGRRRRDVTEDTEANKIFQVKMMTFIKLADVTDPENPFVIGKSPRKEPVLKRSSDDSLLFIFFHSSAASVSLSSFLFLISLIKAAYFTTT